MQPLRQLYHEIVEDLEGVVGKTSVDPTILRKMADKYGLSNVAYLAVNVPTLTDRRPYGVHTYGTDWEERYVAQNYVQIDPVVRQGLMGLLPLDWQAVRDTNDKVRRFFGEAREHRVGQQGLSFPIRGVHGETALFSINANVSDVQWREMKRRSVSDFQILAYHFHTLVLEREGVLYAEVKLTPRETECLKWASGGKTAWETSRILGISEKTVDFFVEQARVKLQAINKVQAVAKAIRLSLI